MQDISLSFLIIINFIVLWFFIHLDIFCHGVQPFLPTEKWNLFIKRIDELLLYIEFCLHPVKKFSVYAIIYVVGLFTIGMCRQANCADDIVMFARWDGPNNDARLIITKSYGAGHALRYVCFGNTPIVVFSGMMREPAAIIVPTANPLTPITVGVCTPRTDFNIGPPLENAPVTTMPKIPTIPKKFDESIYELAPVKSKVYVPKIVNQVNLPEEVGFALPGGAIENLNNPKLKDEIQNGLYFCKKPVNFSIERVAVDKALKFQESHGDHSKQVTLMDVLAQVSKRDHPNVIFALHLLKPLNGYNSLREIRDYVSVEDWSVLVTSDLSNGLRLREGLLFIKLLSYSKHIDAYSKAVAAYACSSYETMLTLISEERVMPGSNIASDPKYMLEQHRVECAYFEAFMSKVNYDVAEERVKQHFTNVEDLCKPLTLKEYYAQRLYPDNTELRANIKNKTEGLRNEPIKDVATQNGVKVGLGVAAEDPIKAADDHKKKMEKEAEDRAILADVHPFIHVVVQDYDENRNN
jgi:hypothetical protein